MGFIDIDLGDDLGGNPHGGHAGFPLDTRPIARIRGVDRPRALFNQRLHGRPPLCPSLPARPIDLAEWEVQALMARTIVPALIRPIEPQPLRLPVHGERRYVWTGKLPDDTYQDVEADAFGRFRDTCPFGKAGDALFVREAWTSIGYGRTWGIEIHYRSDGNEQPNGPHRERDRHVIVPAPDRDDTWRPLRFEPWREAATMPAWASRITTTIKRVVVVDMKNLTPFTLEGCGSPLNMPTERWCWRIDLGAVVVIEPRRPW